MLKYFTAKSWQEGNWQDEYINNNNRLSLTHMDTTQQSQLMRKDHGCWKKASIFMCCQGALTAQMVSSPPKHRATSPTEGLNTNKAKINSHSGQSFNVWRQEPQRDWSFCSLLYLLLQLMRPSLRFSCIILLLVCRNYKCDDCDLRHQVQAAMIEQNPAVSFGKLYFRRVV